MGNATPRPMGILSSAVVFGAFSLLLWMALVVIIPWLHHTFAIPPIIGWYLSGTAFVLLPILLFGVIKAWLELPTRNLGQLSKRLRLNKMNGRDLVWGICGPFRNSVCVSSHSCAGTRGGSSFPRIARVPSAATRLAQMGIRSMDSLVHQQYPGRGVVLAWLRSCPTGGGVGSDGVVAEWHYVVPFPLEFRLVCNAASSAYRVTPALDRTATPKHIGRLSSFTRSSTPPAL